MPRGKTTRNPIASFAWRGISVALKTKTPNQKLLLDNIDGYVRAGELLAIMGPSGSGKTTLLNVLAGRWVGKHARVDGQVLINGCAASRKMVWAESCYAEQDDALIGSLTAWETLYFAAQLSLYGTTTKQERMHRIAAVLDSFGLTEQEGTLVGMPAVKGLSGGQKRRLSVASQLIIGSKIIFLDEPTSGLDSVASREVIRYLSRTAKEQKLIVITSIHQPSMGVFQSFDKLLLLSEGKTAFFGFIADVGRYFERIELPLPCQINPAESLLDMVSSDFMLLDANGPGFKSNETILMEWTTSNEALEWRNKVLEVKYQSIAEHEESDKGSRHSISGIFHIPATPMHRTFVKSYRDPMAYWIRALMTCAFAFIMGTVWFRLDKQEGNAANLYVNSIYFSTAFLSFIAVAYIPSILEDRTTYMQEHKNDLYGPSALVLSNVIIGVPFLLAIAILFTSIIFPLINMHHGVGHFSAIAVYTFLDLYCAESLTFLICGLTSNLYFALMLSAFLNGLWMVAGGFLMPLSELNSLWKYTVHYIDYQSYVFSGLMSTEFVGQNYRVCVPEFVLKPYRKQFRKHRLANNSVCRQFIGEDLLEWYQVDQIPFGEAVGILFGIILALRILGWAAFKWRA